MKNVLFACVSIFLLALAFHLGATNAQSQHAQSGGQFVAVSSYQGWGNNQEGLIVTGAGQVFVYSFGKIHYKGNLNAVLTGTEAAKEP